MNGFSKKMPEIFQFFSIFFKLKSSNFRKFGFNLALIFLANQKKSIELFSQLLTFDNNGLFHVVILELFMVTFTERSTNNIYPEEVLSFYVRILKILMKIVATSNNVISKQKKNIFKKIFENNSI